ncbi:MAG TPA: dynamin family protein [Vicinamibacterales bacterium]|nr:dynamin family protein [Vicinamibacterales bacterium]
MKRILNADQEAVLRDERRVLEDLRVALSRHGAGAEAEQTLERSIRQLDELFLLVVVGEFNAGKSAFVNALLGSLVLKEGVTPTTTEVEILRYGEDAGRTPIEEHLFAVTAPVDLLRDIQIVDTPGTNAIMREHEVITSRFVPRADLVLFVTSADRPFTETERAFLERIRDWGKKVVVAINKVDILEREEEVEQVRAFVERHATALLATTPEVFVVSARLALRGKLGDPAAWEASRFEALERYVRETLDEESRLRLKLLSPLGVASRLLEDQLALASSRIGLLRGDIDTLADVDRQLDVYAGDMARDVAFRMSDIEKVLVDMEQRGHQYFDDTLRIGRVFDLLNRSRVQQGFERDVVADAPQQVERKVGELVDWIVDADFRQWQAVTDHLAERRRQHRDRIIGDSTASAFHLDRTRLIDSVGREAQRVVETYDKSREAQELADGARNAVATSAAVGAGALGLGTLVSVAATTAAADVTGIVMASVVAAIGFFILPAKRRRAKEEMRAKVTALRENLVRALRTEFEREMARGRQRLQEAIAPYARFVRAEHEKLTAMRTDLEASARDIGFLRSRIEDMRG